MMITYHGCFDQKKRRISSDMRRFFELNYLAGAVFAASALTSVFTSDFASALASVFASFFACFTCFTFSLRLHWLLLLLLPVLAVPLLFPLSLRLLLQQLAHLLWQKQLGLLVSGRTLYPLRK
jgi:hypothetical protein